VSQALYEFTWNTFCDWFLELAKPALLGDDKDAADSTRHTLLHVLEATLRLLHPLIPFVTEEIWQHIAPKLGIQAMSISLQPYPQATDSADDHVAAEADIEWLKSVVSALRKTRSERNVPPAKQIILFFQGGDIDDHRRATRFESELKFLARLKSIDWMSDADPGIRLASTTLVGKLNIVIPLTGLIDFDAERTRLAKEITRIEAEIRKSEGKLSSATFVQNAPASVVDQERQRLADWKAQRDALHAQRQRLDKV